MPPTSHIEMVLVVSQSVEGSSDADEFLLKNYSLEEQKSSIRIRETGTMLPFALTLPTKKYSIFVEQLFTNKADDMQPQVGAQLQTSV